MMAVTGSVGFKRARGRIPIYYGCFDRMVGRGGEKS